MAAIFSDLGALLGAEQCISKEQAYYVLSEETKPPCVGVLGGIGDK